MKNLRSEGWKNQLWLTHLNLFYFLWIEGRRALQSEAFDQQYDAAPQVLFGVHGLYQLGEQRQLAVVRDVGEGVHKDANDHEHYVMEIGSKRLWKGSLVVGLKIIKDAATQVLNRERLFVYLVHKWLTKYDGYIRHALTLSYCEWRNYLSCNLCAKLRKKNTSPNTWPIHESDRSLCKTITTVLPPR